MADEELIQTQYRLIEALQESEARYARLVGSLRDVVFRCDLAGRFEFLSHAWTALTGLDAETTLGDTIYDHLHPDDRRRCQEAFAALARDERRQERCELRCLDRSGSHLWVEVSASLERDDFDRSTGHYVGTISDISERKRLAKEREELLGIIKNSADLIGLAAADGTIRYLNPAGRRLLGLSQKENLRQRRIATFYAPDELERITTEILPAVQARGSLQTEIGLLHRNGEVIPALASIGCNSSADGAVESYFIIAHDLRHEREQQQLLQHTQRLESLGVLAGGIAHDFNNILTAILGNAAMASRKCERDAVATQRHLQKIVESSELAADLCRQMLAYSGKGQFVVQPLNLNDVVRTIMQLMHASIDKRVSLRTELAEQLPDIEADSAQIQQVILNLVVNASDALADTGGEIVIKTGPVQIGDDDDSGFLLDHGVAAGGNYVYLEVSDNGVGMDEQTQARLFDPFFTTKPQGHGLGMSAVQGIVRGHHGAIRVESAPGEGTTFRLIFPAIGGAVTQTAPRETDPPRATAQGTILIVDDEAVVREVASAMLMDGGYEVLTAVDGIDAVAQFKRHQPEIAAVLLDMTMPKLDGKGCFEALRKIDPSVRVVLSSGYCEEEVADRFDGKLAGFVQKPYLPETLLATIGEAVGGSGSGRR